MIPSNKFVGTTMMKRMMDISGVEHYREKN